MQGSEGMHGEVRSCMSIVSEHLVVLSVGASTGQFSASDSAAITSTKSNNYWTFLHFVAQLSVHYVIDRRSCQPVPDDCYCIAGCVGQ